jgi:membrane protease subunit (stomatin/prohibitin family)
LKQTEDMLKARAMRMSGLLRRINESGQRTESLLRTAAERMKAAETALEQQFRKEGLVVESENGTDADIDWL